MNLSAMTSNGSQCVFCNARLDLMFDCLIDLQEGVSREQHSLWKCINCGIGQTFPQLCEADLESLYHSDYEPFSVRKGFLQFLTEIKHRSDIRSLKKVLGSELKNNALVFEFGSGSGEFLKKFKNLGCLVSGVEPGATGRRRAAEQFGISLDGTSAESVKFELQWDLIIMRHVLEHLSSPVSVLNNIYQNGLRPGGVLFIKIPRFDSSEFQKFGANWFNLDIPRHRFHFSKAGLLDLLTSVGFSEIVYKNENIPLDYLRSIEYEFRTLGLSGSQFRRLLIRMPKSFSIFIAKLVTMSFVRNVPSRMIFIARK